MLADKRRKTNKWLIAALGAWLSFVLALTSYGVNSFLPITCAEIGISPMDYAFIVSLTAGTAVCVLSSPASAILLRLTVAIASSALRGRAGVSEGEREENRARAARVLAHLERPGLSNAAPGAGSG